MELVEIEAKAVLRHRSKRQHKISLGDIHSLRNRAALSRVLVHARIQSSKSRRQLSIKKKKQKRVTIRQRAFWRRKEGG